VIGVGININQTEFEDAPQAGSIKMMTSKDFNKEDVARKLVGQLNHWYGILLQSDIDLIRKEYHQSLYGYGHLIDIFLAKENKVKQGKVIGVLDDGKVNLEFNDLSQRIFDLDEIKILF
jgi:BirA family biotin operon repressor/biotin-[acetyl-CoA-carboxylase] ligase